MPYRELNRRPSDHSVTIHYSMWCLSYLQKVHTWHYSNRSIFNSNSGLRLVNLFYLLSLNKILLLYYSFSKLRTWVRGEAYTGFWLGNVRERDHLGDPGEDARIILRWIFRKWYVGVWTEPSWLRIGAGGGHLWLRLWTFGFHKMRRISWLPENLLASQEGLSYTDKVSK
jgi:hypothetical protein